MLVSARVRSIHSVSSQRPHASQPIVRHQQCSQLNIRTSLARPSSFCTTTPLARMEVESVAAFQLHPPTPPLARLSRFPAAKAKSEKRKAKSENAPLFSQAPTTSTLCEIHRTRLLACSFSSGFRPKACCWILNTPGQVDSARASVYIAPTYIYYILVDKEKEGGGTGFSKWQSVESHVHFDETRLHRCRHSRLRRPRRR